MKVWKIGDYYTSAGREYADGMRKVISINTPNPGPVVELEMTPEEWEKLQPTAIDLGLL